MKIDVNLPLWYISSSLAGVLLDSLTGGWFHQSRLSFWFLLALRALDRGRCISETPSCQFWRLQSLPCLCFECLGWLESLYLRGSLILVAAGCGLSHYGGLLVVDVLDIQVYLIAAEPLGRSAALLCVVGATGGFGCLLDMRWRERQIWGLRNRDVNLPDLLPRVLAQGIFRPRIIGNISTFLISSPLANIWAQRSHPHAILTLIT